MEGTTFPPKGAFDSACRRSQYSYSRYRIRYWQHESYVASSLRRPLRRNRYADSVVLPFPHRLRKRPCLALTRHPSNCNARWQHPAADSGSQQDPRWPSACTPRRTCDDDALALGVVLGPPRPAKHLHDIEGAQLHPGALLRVVHLQPRGDRWQTAKERQVRGPA